MRALMKKESRDQSAQNISIIPGEFIVYFNCRLTDQTLQLLTSPSTHSRPSNESGSPQFRLFFFPTVVEVHLMAVLYSVTLAFYFFACSAALSLCTSFPQHNSLPSPPTLREEGGLLPDQVTNPTLSRFPCYTIFLLSTANLFIVLYYKSKQKTGFYIVKNEITILNSLTWFVSIELLWNIETIMIFVLGSWGEIKILFVLV